MDTFLNGELPKIITINRKQLIKIQFIIISGRKYSDGGEQYFKS